MIKTNKDGRTRFHSTKALYRTAVAVTAGQKAVKFGKGVHTTAKVLAVVAVGANAV